MADPDLVLRIPHSLGAAEAKRRIADFVKSAASQYDKYLRVDKAEWDGAILAFSVSALAQTVSGSIDVQDDHVEIRAHLPLLIRLLTKRFLPTLRDTGQKLLT